MGVGYKATNRQLSALDALCVPQMSKSHEGAHCNLENKQNSFKDSRSQCKPASKKGNNLKLATNEK